MSGGVSAATVFAGIGAAAAVASATGILGGKGGTPATPAIEKPPVMPTTDDAAVRKARERSLVEQQARSGRASTIFTQGDTLG